MNAGPQRWGDYNAMVYNPFIPGPGGEGVFEEIEEITKGGVDETTNFEIMADLDTLPFFVGSTQGEAQQQGECLNVPNGQDCALTLTTPPSLQNGDVVIAALDMGGSFPNPPTPPDTSWVVVPIVNKGNATSMQQGVCGTAADLRTEYVFAHVYNSPTEIGSYRFTHLVEPYCSGNFKPEIEGALFAYRGGDNNLANLLLYGYPDALSQTITVGPSPAPSTDGTLLNIFNGGILDVPESQEYQQTFSAPTQTPFTAPETPRVNPPGPYFLTDVWIPTANTSLPLYSSTTTAPAIRNFGWQLFLREP